MNGPKGIDYFIGDGSPSLAGDAFVVIKASEGAGFPPPGAPEMAWYPQQQARARAAGALFGAFHYWHPSVDNAAQVANFKARANLAPGDVIQLDAETTDGLDWATVNTRKNDMLSRLKSEFPMCRVLLYTDLDYWNHIDGNVADGLWIADPSAPAGAPRVAHWVIHQYAASNVDYDIANFPDATALRTWATGLIPQPAPKEPEMILVTGMNATDVYGLSGGLYWHINDGDSVQGYRNAGVPEATITPAEHQRILAAKAVAEPVELEAVTGQLAPIQVDASALTAAVVAALSDPKLLAAQGAAYAHAMAVQEHNDTPAT